MSEDARAGTGAGRLPYAYRLFGLRLASAVALPELDPLPGGGPHDVAIRTGTIPPSPDGKSRHLVTEEGTTLWIANVGRFLVRNGSEIVVDADSGTAAHDRNIFLLGSAFGILLHQRGLVPLHANAVVIDGRAIAFSGHSGAGKSTIAACFHDRGFPVLADDVCVISPGESSAGSSAPLVSPGIPRVRLWREAMEASGRDPAGHRRSFSGVEKFDVQMTSVGSEALPLHAVYMLARAPDGAESLRVRRLRGAEAVEQLVANTYRGAYVGSIGRTGAHLAQCVEISRRVPVFRAERLWGFDRLAEQAALLEDHARGLLDAPAGSASG